MTTTIRPATADDLELLLSINNAAVPAVNHLSPEDLKSLADMASYFSVSVTDGETSGFLLALDQSCDYHSMNYRWFQGRYEQFIYIDRVVVAKDFRGLGIGSVFYADLQSFCEQRAPLLTCEVNLIPRNDISLLFHGTHGFNEVGQQATENGDKRVSLLAKEIPAYQYVYEKYHSHELRPISDSE